VTKTRAPLSVEQALQRIAGQLPEGIDSMARIAARQPGTVRNWMDPDRDEQVSLDAAIELDLAYRAAGGAGSPLFECFGARLDLADADKFLQAHRLHDYAHGVIKEGGEAHAAIVAAARPGASPIEKKIAFKEAVEAYEKLRDILPLLEEGARAFHGTAEGLRYENAEGGEVMAQAP
jgi:hypothetical protein